MLARNADEIADLREILRELRTEVRILSLALANRPNGGGDDNVGWAFNRLKFPEPKAYGGTRDARELENYLFDMEQYFEATGIDGDAAKITTAAMYFTGDAKLWWRSQKADIQAGRLAINTWDELK